MVEPVSELKLKNSKTSKVLGDVEGKSFSIEDNALDLLEELLETDFIETDGPLICILETPLLKYRSIVTSGAGGDSITTLSAPAISTAFAPSAAFRSLSFRLASSSFSAGPGAESCFCFEAAVVVVSSRVEVEGFDCVDFNLTPSFALPSATDSLS
jgi:hypothetical protein